MKVTVNPNTETSGFGYVDAQPARLRVVKCEWMEGKKYPYLKWEMELVDKSIKSTDGKSEPGHIFENTTLKNESEKDQFRLRQVCDALDIAWGDFDTEEVIGMECDVQLGIHEYQGKMSNEVKKFIPVEQA